ncbi:MAG: ATP-binding protein [Candidatus Muiribacteriota bacterium]
MDLKHNFTNIILKTKKNIEKIISLIEKYESGEIPLNDLKNEVSIQIRIIKGGAILFDYYEIVKIYKNIEAEFLEVLDKSENKKNCLPNLKFFFICLYFMKVDENYSCRILKINGYIQKNWNFLNSSSKYGMSYAQLFYIYFKMIRLKRALKYEGKADEENWINFFDEFQYMTVIDFEKFREDFFKLKNQFQKEFNREFNLIFENECPYNFRFFYNFYEKFYNWIFELLKNTLSHSFKEKMNIYLTLNCDEDFMILSFTDDGKGINLKGKLKKEIEEICSRVFQKGFTTKKDSDFLSGRGIGLFNLEKEIKEIDGHVLLKINKNGNFCFTIKIPDKYAVIY